MAISNVALLPKMTDAADRQRFRIFQAHGAPNHRAGNAWGLAGCCYQPRDRQAENKHMSPGPRMDTHPADTDHAMSPGIWYIRGLLLESPRSLPHDLIIDFSLSTDRNQR